MSSHPIAVILRLLAVSAMVVAAVSQGAAQTAQEPFGTTVEVRRILTEVRVVERSGEPVPNLGPDDFRVSIDGRPASVESVLWVPTSNRELVAVPPREDGPVILTDPEPRLIVVVFQTDINLYKIKGLMRMAPEAARFVRGLDDGDRVALLTYESHLELRSDFTHDHEALAAMLTTREVLNGRMAAPEPASPSLALHFDEDAARRSSTLTRALQVVGASLAPIEGPKTVVLFGWGLGRYNAGHPITEPSYGPAVQALATARASVFSLDITTADHHTLELGLRRISEDTGGLYIKTHRFPGTAIDKLTRMITSYYELSIIPPPDIDEDYKIKVVVKRPGTEVFVRQNAVTRRW